MNELSGIVLQNVYFRYKNREAYVIKGITGFIKPGTTLSIIGTTGCGKSTLAMLIAGIYSPTRGQIWIEGQRPDILLGKTLFYVHSNPHIFIGTIQDNITLWDKFPAVDIKKALRICQLDDLDLHMQVGEGRGELSLGQKQRIALARAIIRQPKVLILDEATSGLDSKTEEKIFRHLLNMKHLTLIIISHRLSTIKSSDKVWVMKDGTIVSSGAHQELLHKCDEYIKLFEKQIIT